MPRLIVNPGSPSAWEIQLKPGTNSLGRGDGNDFVIADASVSGHHCQILVGADSVSLKDLHSTNGTYLNRAPVQEAVLKHGQTIHLGGVPILFFADAAPGASGIPAHPPAAGAVARPRQASTVSIPVRVVPKRGIEPVKPAAASAPVVLAAPIPPPTAAVSAPKAELEEQVFALPPPATPPASPPVAIPSTPLAPPPVAAPAQSPKFCKSHPKTQARFHCNQCHASFCELCVDTRIASGTARKFCRQCGTECTPLQVVIRRPEAPKGFFQRLPSAFGYPFRGSGPLLLIFGAIVISAVNLLSAILSIPFRFALSVIVLGYLFGYLQSILHATAAGDEELPQPGGMSDMWGDIVLPCLQLVGLSLICFGPAILLSYIAVQYKIPAAGIAIIPAFIFGCLYFPMAFLSVAMLDSVMAANPVNVVPSILKVPLHYVVMVIVLGLLLAVRALGDEIIPLLFPRGMITKNMTRLIGMLTLKSAWGVVSLYLLLVNVRILGLLFVCNRQKLGWFER